MAGGRGNAVACLQGRGDVEWIADRRYDPNFGAELLGLLDPEFQQAADPGILEHEEPAVTVLLLQQYLRLLAKFSGDRRSVPARIEGSPIVPRGSSGRENFVVQIHNAL